MTSHNWELSDNGMIGQSFGDIQDPNLRIFTETAQQHNQKIHDFRQGKV
jgi:hypothetical protein